MGPVVYVFKSCLIVTVEHVVSQNIVLASLEESTETSFKSCLIVTAEHVVSRNIVISSLSTET